MPRLLGLAGIKIYRQVKGIPIKQINEGNEIAWEPLETQVLRRIVLKQLMCCRHKYL
jgi:hypothetical protein